MTPTLRLILLLFAFCCFGLASWQSGSPYWNRIVAVGAAAFVLAQVSF